jgi:hypothetical protein
MQQRSFLLAGVLVSTLFGAPTLADIIAYRTEDGVFAYTDDHDKVPARYAPDAVTVRDSALHAYPRLTVEDTQTARAVTSRLEKRLDYLRQVNAASQAERAVAETSAASNTVIRVPTGSTNAPTIEVSANTGEGPIVVEPILTKESGSARTRRATIVKQDGKILAITKGPRHHFDVNSDIHDEDALEGR